MKFVRQLDGHTKLYAACAIVVCFGGLLAFWQLHAFDQLSRLAASQDAAAPFEQLGAGVAAARLWNGWLLAAEAALAVLLALRLAAARARPLQSRAAPTGGELALGSKRRVGAREETAASMRQLTASVKRHADYAHRAGKLAASASEMALKASEAADAMVGTMASINNASRQIAEIVGFIDALAFQTNILALNGAVEAARADAQGPGFAVVAAEVRLLAQRSADAAREIKILIAGSVEQVRAGAVLADRAGGTMRAVVADVRRVTAIVGEIADASYNRASSSHPAEQAIGQTDRSVRHNAAPCDCPTAAALPGQPGDLGRIVATFTPGPEQARPGAALRLIISNPGLPTPRSGARPRAYLRIAAAPARGAAPKRGDAGPAPACE